MVIKSHLSAAVVGNPIAHSLSPQLHQAGWGAKSFPRIQLLPGEFADFLDSCDSSSAGFAVTMPFKFDAIKYADMTDGLAKAVGAANTIVFQPTGANSRMSIAFNTDVNGIVNAIVEVVNQQDEKSQNTFCVSQKFKNSVILGSGATASSALAALMQLGAEKVVVCARRNSGPNTVFSTAHRLHIALGYQPINDNKCVKEFLASDLVISTLPAGVADSTANSLAELIATDFSHDSSTKILNGKVLLDVSYDPYPSKLIEVWQKYGGVVVPGWLMLLHQAIDQARLFTGRMPDICQMRKTLQKELMKKKIDTKFSLR